MKKQFLVIFPAIIALLINSHAQKYHDHFLKIKRVEINESVKKFTYYYHIPISLFIQEFTWQQEYQGYLNNRLIYAYSGGFDYCKPALVNIDNHRNLFLFVGKRNDGVNFYRNVGNVNNASWQLKSKNVF